MYKECVFRKRRLDPINMAHKVNAIVRLPLTVFARGESNMNLLGSLIFLVLGYIGCAKNL